MEEKGREGGEWRERRRRGGRESRRKGERGRRKAGRVGAGVVVLGGIDAPVQRQSSQLSAVSGSNRSTTV